jgi:apolipoprotein N-acyltransferase
MKTAPIPSLLTRLIPDLSALAAGAFLTLTLAPYNLKWMAWLPPCLLFCLIQSCTQKRAVFRGYLFGFGLFLCGNSWIYRSIHDYGHTSPLLAGSFAVLLALFMGLYSALKIWLFRRLFDLRIPHYTAPLRFALIWMLCDVLQGALLTGYPWLYLGYTQVNGPLGGYLPIVGTFGVTLIIVLMGAGLGMVFLKPTPNMQRITVLASMVVILLLNPWLNTIAWTHPQHRPVSVALIQGNIPQATKWSAARLEANLATYERLTPFDAKNTILIWPEAALTLPLPYSEPIVNRWHLMLLKHQNTLLMGIPVKAAGNNPKYYNGIIQLDPKHHPHTQAPRPSYYKRHLLIFGDFVPFESLLRGLIAFFDLPMSQFIPGPAVQPPLSTGTLRWAPFICYEIAYLNDVLSDAQHADILLTISNDTWFGDSIGPQQHFQIATARAKETGRMVIRVANSGITAIISPTGEVIQQAPQFEPYVLSGTVQGYSGQTPVMFMGAHGIWVSGLILLILLCAWTRCSKR